MALALISALVKCLRQAEIEGIASAPKFYYQYRKSANPYEMDFWDET